MSIESQILEGKTPKEIGISDREYKLYAQHMLRSGFDFSPLDLDNLPPAKQQLKNLIHASKQMLKSGFKLASEEEQEKRISICLSCEFLREKDDRCIKCGCFMRMKIKMEAWHCPIGKW